MIRVSNIKIDIDNNNKEYIISKLEKKYKTKILNLKIVRKSIDARNGIKFVYSFDINTNNEEEILKYNKDVIVTPNEDYFIKITGNKELKYRPVVVGLGPAGLFMAYYLAKLGYKPIVIERGEKMEDRIKTVNDFWDNNILNPNSNVLYGEGGAGTFSDGKLNSINKDKEHRIKKIYEIFVECRAPKEILYDYKPHIGSDKLREVIINLRNKIISMGAEIRYNTKLTDLKINNNKLEGIIVNNNEEIKTNNLFLAIGHSARDTFMMLYKNNLNMKSKPFAVGLRIEHREEDIDKSLYGKYYKKLNAAPYKLTYRTKDNYVVYSFCMCPGGYVVNTSNEKNMLVINGMSNYNRDSGISNSAIVVSVSQKDFGYDLFDGMNFQIELEKKAYELGNGKIPAQRYIDFKNNKISKSFKYINTKGEYKSANLNNLLPKYLNDKIKEAMPHFKKQISCFEDDDAVLLGVESRTSSPITILRDENNESNIKGIYPVGEGAGYSGGITTSIVDGLKTIEKFTNIYKPTKEDK